MCADFDAMLRHNWRRLGISAKEVRDAPMRVLPWTACFVEGCCDARQSCLNLLPYVGPGWHPKVSLAAMLGLGVCRWDHIVLGISARSHVDAATLRRALERMDAAWPEGEERMAKLSVNAMIGLWARSAEVVYSVRSSSSELDGAGADFSQAFA